MNDIIDSETDGRLDTKPWHFLINSSVTQRDGTQDARNMTFPVNEDGKYEITFKVNGVDVPFKATIEEIYGRMHAEIDKLAAKRALEMVTEAGLSEVRELMYNLKFEIAEKFRKAGIKIEDEY